MVVGVPELVDVPAVAPDTNVARTRWSVPVLADVPAHEHRTARVLVAEPAVADVPAELPDTTRVRPPEPASVAVPSDEAAIP